MEFILIIETTGKAMEQQEKYIPIDCGFYDRIELAIMRRQKVDLVINDAGEERSVLVRMTDTVQNTNGEYVRLEDESLLRMDRIVSLDGVLSNADSESICSIKRSF